MERPRKKGAKFTGKNIAADDIITEFNGGYDAKRDRWNGYDPTEHKKIMDEYAAVEAVRQKMREEEIDNQTTTDLAAVKKLAKASGGAEKDHDFGSSDEDDADEEKYADAADAVGQKLDTKTRITVRNLRIREDTAKYLINLDPESAYYDPKTRSMRDAPDKSIRPEDVSLNPHHMIRQLTYNLSPNLLVITSFGIQVTLLQLKNCKCLLGRHRKRVTMWIWPPTLLPVKSITKNMRKRRRPLGNRTRPQFLTGMAASNIYKKRPRNF
jgi:hypothetical protein